MNGLSKYYIKKIINCFAQEITATETARKLKVNRNTVNKYYRMIRDALVDYQEVQARILNLHTSDKKYFFGWHTNGGLIFTPREDASLFSLSISAGKVFIKAENMHTIKDSKFDEAVPAGSNPDANLSANVTLVKPQPAFSATLSTQQEPNKNMGNEPAMNFFLYAKQKLIKFYGVKEEFTFLYLKELEFRFNNNGRDLTNLIFKLMPHHSPEWIRTTKNRK